MDSESGRTGFCFNPKIKLTELCRLVLCMGLCSAGVHDSSAQSCSPPPSGLVGWWSGDGTVNSLVGTNNGTLQGGATATGVGMVGQAFSFNGTTAYVQVPDSSLLRSTNLTVEAWVMFTSLDSTGNSTAGQQYIVFKQNTRSSYFEGYYLGKERVSGKDIFAFGVSSSSGASVSVKSTSAITTGVWYHVAGVRGSNFIQLYVNGQLIGQASVTFAQNYGNFPLYFGSSGESYWDHKLAGLLDEVSLYSRALSAAEITAVYTAGAAGKCKPGGSLSITTQPQSQTVAVGSNVLFTVAASGAAPLNYQWQVNGSPISGATASSLTLNNAQTTASGNYSAVVTNSSGSVTSSIAVLTVLIPPGISSPPQDLTVLAGGTANFSATATGSAPLSYQWKLGGVNVVNGARISGATTSALSITSAQASDAGNYTLAVSNAVGSVTSSPAALTVNGPPVVTTPPASQSVVAGNNALFTVAATGTAPLSYQWQFNGGPVNGATTTSLAITGAQPGNQGNYTVVVTNVAGSVTSSVALLTISAPVSSTNVANGATITIPDSGAATPYPSIINVAGMAGVISKATVTLNNLSHTYIHDVSVLLVGPGGRTALLMSHVGGTFGVTNIALTFDDTASASLPPSSRVVAGTYKPTNGGGTVAFPSPAPSGAYGTALTTFNGSSPNGTWALYVFDDAANDKGSIAGGWSLTLVSSNSPPTIASQPSSISSVVGANVGFSVNALGTPPLTYQWLFYGTNLTDGGQVGGSTTSALALGNIQPNNAGPYSAVVSNPYGSATSSVATLTVNLPGTCAPPVAGLVGWWPGDGTANDIIGNNNGTLVGGASASASGFVGTAFKFDGTNSYVQIPDSPVLRPTNLTVECWVRFDSLDSAGNSTVGAQYIVFKQNTRSSVFEGYNLSKHRYAADIFVWEVSSAAGVPVQINSVSTIQTGVWYHVAGVRGPDYVQLYVNGQLEAQASVNFPQDYGNYPLYFGTSAESYWDHKLAGALDEVSLYNRALSPSEIAAIYAAGSAGKCKPASAPLIASQPSDVPLMGNYPLGALSSSQGFLYGATSGGGISRSGTVFRAELPPKLNITAAATGLVLSWPANGTSFVLQSTTNLSSPVWTVNLPAPIVINGQNTVSNPVSGTQQFFRLSQ